MKNTFCSLLFLLITTIVFPAIAQTNPANSSSDQASDNQVYMAVEEMPEFPGGNKAMSQFLAANIKYPKAAMRNGLAGVVVLSFVVNKEGLIEDIQVLKPLGGGTDEEAIRVVKMMPAWKPGKQNGKPVKTRFTLPVRFAVLEPAPAK